MQRNFDGNKTLSWNEMKQSKQGASSRVNGIKNNRDEKIWLEMEKKESWKKDFRYID